MVDHSELAREKMWSRIYLIPLLQAEEDRDLVRRHYADKAREKALLGGETDVYHSDRCVISCHCLSSMHEEVFREQSLGGRFLIGQSSWLQV